MEREEVVLCEWAEEVSKVFDHRIEAESGYMDIPDVGLGMKRVEAITFDSGGHWDGAEAEKRLQVKVEEYLKGKGSLIMWRMRPRMVSVMEYNPELEMVMPRYKVFARVYAD